MVCFARLIVVPAFSMKIPPAMKIRPPMNAARRPAVHFIKGVSVLPPAVLAPALIPAHVGSIHEYQESQPVCFPRVTSGVPVVCAGGFVTPEEQPLIGSQPISFAAAAL